MERQVGIIGAGLSGLLSCRYCLEKGMNPVVFEADQMIGGVWAHTIESTRLQDPKTSFQFSDFPWPSSVKDVFPTNTQVMDYFVSYASHFALFPYINFNSKVLGIQYVGESFKKMASWELWGGTGKAFGSKGKWHIRVQNTKACIIQSYQVDFVILCIGEFSGFPNIPEFPPSKGPEVFEGKVMHSSDYSAMDNRSAAEFIRGKRITIIGAHKSAVDIAVECASMNGAEYPCTIIQRAAHWFLPSGDYLCGLFLVLYLSRFFELMVHKPGESFLFSILAILLSPLRWGISKLFESYLKWKLPLKKYGMIPKHSFDYNMSACQLAKLPDKFFEKVEEGSIVIKNSQSTTFFKKGLIINGDQLVETDAVILATGFRGDQKLRSIFECPVFQQLILGPPSNPIPLYRQAIHPRLPRVAVMGYVGTYSTTASTELRCQWLMQLLEGKIELPCIREMEKDTKVWADYNNKTAGKYSRRTCAGSTTIWCNDQLCRDMGCCPRRKRGFLTDLFVPYESTDYAGLLANA